MSYYYYSALNIKEKPHKYSIVFNRVQSCSSMLTRFNNLPSVYLLDLINPNPLVYILTRLISSLFFDWTELQFIILFYLIYSITLTQLENIPPSTSSQIMVKTQPINPELTKIIWGNYIPIFLVVIIFLSLNVPAWRFSPTIGLSSYYLPSACRLYICIGSIIRCANHHP